MMTRDKIQNRAWKVLLRMRMMNMKIQILVAHVHFERENKTACCACALREKFTIRTGSWPYQIVGESRQPWAGVCLRPIVFFLKV